MSEGARQARVLYWRERCQQRPLRVKARASNQVDLTLGVVHSFQTAHQSRNQIHTRRQSSLISARRSADAMPYQNQSMITFAAGQAKKMWPFIAGFGVVGYGVTVATLGITEEDKKKSGFLNPGGHH
jgi:hypothetical protein